MPSALSLLRSTNALLSPVWPRLAADVAAHLFTTPRRHSPPAHERLAEQQGQRIRISSYYDSEGLSALRFGHGPRRVLAIHGWEGRATQWGALAERLTPAGFTLVALDGPGHGRSPGKRAHPVAFVNALLDADAELGPFDAVIAHSMGVPATALALSRGLRAKRAVLIAGPSNIAAVLERFSRFMALSPAAAGALETRVEAIVGLPARELSITELGPQLDQRALVIHSKDDREIPFGDAEQLAEHWPRARLLAVNGLGHRRIVRDPGVIDAIVAELSVDEAPTMPASPAANSHHRETGPNHVGVVGELCPRPMCSC